MAKGNPDNILINGYTRETIVRGYSMRRKMLKSRKVSKWKYIPKFFQFYKEAQLFAKLQGHSLPTHARYLPLGDSNPLQNYILDKTAPTFMAQFYRYFKPYCPIPLKNRKEAKEEITSYRNAYHNYLYSKAYLASAIGGENSRDLLSKSNRLLPLVERLDTSGDKYYIYTAFAERWIAQQVRRGLLPHKALTAKISFTRKLFADEVVTQGGQAGSILEGRRLRAYVYIGAGKITAFVVLTDERRCIIIQSNKGAMSVSSINYPNILSKGDKRLAEIVGMEMKEFVDFVV